MIGAFAQAALLEEQSASCTFRGTIKRTMRRSSRHIKVDVDIKPVSEFRANAAELIERVKTSGRPLVLTQRGRSSAVVVDAVDYEQMVEEIELLRDVQTAVRQIDAGKGVAHRTAKRELRKRFGR